MSGLRLGVFLLNAVSAFVWTRSKNWRKPKKTKGIGMDVSSILNKLLHAFDAPDPAPLPELDEKLALGALMVRVAMSDHAYKFDEISRIDRLLSRLYDLGPIEAAKMRAVCERLEKQAPDTDEFAKLIRTTVSFAARVDAIEALWEVVLADGIRREEEIAVVEEVCAVLGLEKEDSDAAKQRAEAQSE